MNSEEEDLVVFEENTKKKKKNENIGFFGNLLPRVFHQMLIFIFFFTLVVKTWQLTNSFRKLFVFIERKACKSYLSAILFSYLSL